MARDRTPTPLPAPEPEVDLPPPTTGGTFERLPDGGLRELPGPTPPEPKAEPGAKPETEQAPPPPANGNF